MQCGKPGFDPWVGKIPWRRERLPTPVFWPEEFHGLHSPWGHKESGMTERLWLSWLQCFSRIPCQFTFVQCDFFFDRTHKKLIRSAGTQRTSICLAHRVLVRSYPAHPVALVVKNLSARAKGCRSFNPWVRRRWKWQPTPVFLPGKVPWTEEPGGAKVLGPQRVGHDGATENNTHLFITWTSQAEKYHRLWGLCSYWRFKNCW